MIRSSNLTLHTQHTYTAVQWRSKGGGKGGGRPGRRVERGAKIVGKKIFL